MVAARRDVEEPRLPRFVIDGRDDGYVRQVCAAIVGCVQHINVARSHVRVLIDDSAHARAHRAQMHRHVGCVGNQPTLTVEDGAGKVQPLLDIHG